jgi:hypothetical protein
VRVRAAESPLHPATIAIMIGTKSTSPSRNVGSARLRMFPSAGPGISRYGRLRE